MGVTASLMRVPDSVLKSLVDDPDKITDVLDGDCEEVSIDKAWQGIHFLLNGDPETGTPPLDFIVTGGTQIGDIDVGYGPARGFTPFDVKAIDTALAALSSAELRSRFDAKAMMDGGVYPEIWDRAPDEDDSLGYLIEYYEDLKALIGKAASKGEALLVYFS